MNNKQLFTAIGNIDDKYIIETGANIQRTVEKRRLKMRPLLIAAVLSVLVFVLVGTTFAYGDVITQFIFGNSSAEQVNPIEGHSHGFEIVNGFGEPIPNVFERHDSASFDEIRALVSFDVQYPSYLPYEGHWDISVMSAYRVYAAYWFNGNTNPIHMFQYFSGDDAYIKLASTHPIEKVMVGNIEATALFDGISNWLYWMNDGIVFELFSNTYDIDTLIVIAKSVS
ncbi:MAG: DUF4367 domain-containing protein [Oscillospiraceae bacterium]|jgi:hypothetical protein|nr:DUF4367 domain-containing protein [Oscillospiraceae bacterium]